MDEAAASTDRRHRTALRFVRVAICRNAEARSMDEAGGKSGEIHASKCSVRRVGRFLTGF